MFNVSKGFKGFQGVSEGFRGGQSPRRAGFRGLKRVEGFCGFQKVSGGGRVSVGFRRWKRGRFLILRTSYSRRLQTLNKIQYTFV